MYFGFCALHFAKNGGEKENETRYGALHTHTHTQRNTFIYFINIYLLPVLKSFSMHTTFLIDNVIKFYSHQNFI